MPEYGYTGPPLPLRQPPPPPNKPSRQQLDSRRHADAAARLGVQPARDGRGRAEFEKSKAQLLALQQLFRLWAWVERVEELCTTKGWVFGKPVTGIANAGVEALLLAADGASSLPGGPGLDSARSRDQVLGCPLFQSQGRQMVLQACGWAASLDDDDPEDGGRDAVDGKVLQHTMLDCEGTGDFDRAAALAIFHGDLREKSVQVRHAGVVLERSPSDRCVVAVEEWFSFRCRG